MNYAMAGTRAVSALVTAAAVLWLVDTTLPAQPAPAAQPAPRYTGPRTADKRPNLNGIWQANSSAHWNLEAHSAQASPVLELGAQGAIPAGQSVVEGGAIPYLPAALAKKKENQANRLKADPEVLCLLPGVPRATYMPYPFQIVQTPQWVLMAYEYDGAARTINMDNKQPEMPIDAWMGYSWGRWEGDTMVIETKGQNDRTWFDRAGNFHTENLHVLERFTPQSADVVMYEATMTDPQVFSRPWKISLPLYRRVEKNAQILEFNCVAMTEELRYGPMLKPKS